MRQLMISLDNNILNTHSAVARRMVAYGMQDELYIIAPSNTTARVDLSPTAHVYSVGGSKIPQFFGLYRLGLELVHKYNIQCITTQDPFFTGLIGYLIARRTHIPLEVQLHGDFYGSYYYLTSGIMNAVRYYIGLFVIPRADTVRSVSERIKRSLIARGMSDRKITLQPVRVDSEYIKTYQPKFDVHERYPDARRIFLCMGRFDKVKNIPWLVEIFAEVVHAHSDVLLLIVGEGPERKKIEQTIKRLGVAQNVQLEQWANDSYSYLKTADCLLFPSLSEGYGMVVIEAVAAGCRVIMNDVGVARFEAPSSELTTIISIGDKEKFRQAIGQICN